MAALFELPVLISHCWINIYIRIYIYIYIYVIYDLICIHVVVGLSVDNSIVRLFSWPMAVGRWALGSLSTRNRKGHAPNRGIHRNCAPFKKGTYTPCHLFDPSENPKAPHRKNASGAVSSVCTCLEHGHRESSSP